MTAISDVIPDTMSSDIFAHNEIIAYSPDIHPRKEKYTHGTVKCLQDWIFKALWVHGIGRYSYKKIEQYRGSESKIDIECMECGSLFNQRAGSHTNDRSGCVHCRTIKQTHTIDDILSKLKQVQPVEFYENMCFSKSVYKNFDSPIEILCLSCKQYFKQYAPTLFKGYGCPRCNNTRNYQQTTNQAITEFVSVHGNFYDYSEFVYNRADEKSTIICPAHGRFFQSYHIHSQEVGCPSCGKQKATISEINNMPKEEKDKPAILYHIRVKPKEGKSFDKIGITTNSIHKRFNNGYSEYSIDIIGAKTGRKEDILLEEIHILNLMESQGARWKFQYLREDFGGWSECFFPEDFDPMIASESRSSY